ncbi:MAG TPA: TetR/AcrR family transcriptional regulator [Cellulomonas sp.]
MATTTPFLRARSEEQRTQRRSAILAAASQMLSDGMPIRELSLNELARRVGLAKSNVLRYFESREAVLLTLLDQEYGAWLDSIAGLLGGPEEEPAPWQDLVAAASSGTAAPGSDEATTATTAAPDPAALEAAEQVADVLSRTVVDRPVLSELLAHAQLVLEQNVSAEVAADYKRRAVAQAGRLVLLVERRIGTLPGPSRVALAGGVNMAIGGVWAQCRPSAGMTAAYQRYPELAALRLDQRVVLRELLATVLTGLLTRPVRQEGPQ